tara:strand:+ start:789 stop:1943 length:1155 start_codon:yes stop_codon:yes gene_type:complete
MLRSFLDKIKPLFEKDGKYEYFYPLYDALDTFLYTPDSVTKNGPHIRDSIDLKRSMIFVVIAMIPAILFGIFNVGYQEDSSRTVLENFLSGLMTVGPIIIVSYSVGGFWEVVFALVRKHEVNEGFLVTGMLIPLVMPPTIPLWMVAVATSFGVVIGKEIFGGTGFNIFNPALVARAFIFFAYPAQISGDMVWKISKVDGVSTATPLLTASSVQGSNVEALDLLSETYSFIDMFLGFIPGSIGETSTLACIMGALFLLITRIGSWRIMLGVIIGMILTSLLAMQLAPYSDNPMLSLPPHYHFVMGGFAFGLAFMATEPVTASHTNLGRWIYGLLIGFMVVVIRAINPAYPEGMMLAILFANAFAPLIDYFILQKNIKNRMLRNEK